MYPCATFSVLQFWPPRSPKSKVTPPNTGIMKINVSGAESCEVEVELQILQMADVVNIY